MCVLVYWQYCLLDVSSEERKRSMKNIDLIRKVDFTYPDLEDRNIIETLAVGKQVNGELRF